MSVIQASVEVNAPPEEVWKVVADPRNLSRWDRHIAKVEGVPREGLQEGTRYTTELRVFGARAHVNSEVLELSAPNHAKVRIEGIATGTVETWLEPLVGNRTRLRHRVDFRLKGGPIGQLAARAINVLGAATLLRRGAEAQKLQAEAAAG
jgi:carbon monoxide dehydrogenase subunit G